MNAARILYPVRVLGPGRRVGIWVAGCERGCPGCSNPELWRHREEYEITVERLSGILHELAAQHPVDGFTITGGEPMDQAQELCALLDAVADVSRDVLVYSGYTVEELRSGGDVWVQNVLDRAAVLIDGAYVEEKNTNVPLRGSSNQRVHVLREEYRTLYETYLEETPNRIQNFTTADGIVSVGIHRAGFSSGRKGG